MLDRDVMISNLILVNSVSESPFDEIDYRVKLEAFNFRELQLHHTEALKVDDWERAFFQDEGVLKHDP